MKQKIWYLLGLFIVAIALHAVWEFSHQGLYTVHNQPVPLMRLLQSIVGDGIITCLIYLLARKRWWLIVTLGLSIAILVEINALYISHLWEYRLSMPTIWGLGISPLLQMSVLPSASILLANRGFARFKNA